MRSQILLIGLLLLSSVHAQDNKVHIINVGGTTPVGLSRTYHIPLIPGIEFSQKDIDLSIARIRSGRVDGDTIIVTTTKTTVERILSAASLPLVNSTQGNTQLRLVSFGLKFKDALTYDSKITSLRVSSNNGWTEGAGISNFILHKSAQIGEIEVHAYYIDNNGDQIKKASTYIEPNLKTKPVVINDLVTGLKLNKKNIIKVKYFKDFVHADKNAFNYVCSTRWNFNAQEQVDMLIKACSYPVEYLGVKYRVRLYFKDQDGLTRYITMITRSILDDFKSDGKTYMEMPMINKKNYPYIDGLLNAEYTDRLIQVLNDPNSRSDEKFSFDFTGNSQRIGWANDELDTDLRIPESKFNWRPNSTSWKVE